MKENYTDERYCEHCDLETNHNCRDGEHERDSSDDFEECLKCGWWKNGILSHKVPPFDMD
jgi:hypothetical protein